MEATKSTNKIQISQMPQNKQTNNKRKKDQQGETRDSSSTRRTRSQAAPEWTTKEALILVIEIAAVEGDCSKALSSYQKWKIVVGNCTALDVQRTLSQCRKKWNSLLAEYNQIKHWDLKARTDLYWNLESGKRKEFGLPEDFDGELFRAIDDYVRAKTDHPDTDPDTDPEAEADLLEVIAKLGSKKQKRRLMPQKTYVGEKPQKCCTKEKPEKIHDQLEVEPKETLVEENLQTIHGQQEPQESHEEQNPQKIHTEEEHQESCVEEKPKKGWAQKNKIIITEETEQMMVGKLLGNAELIHAIVEGNLPEMADFGTAGVNNVEDFQTEFVRRQGDKLIACLGDIVNILNQFPHLVQECD